MSLVEAFHLPLKVIDKTYTKSEIRLMGWRSQELAHQLFPKDKEIRYEEKSLEDMTSDELMKSFAGMGISFNTMG